MITKQEARELIREAVREALAQRPAPSCVSVTEAAKMLGVSRRTAVRMNLPRNAAGKIPYEAVLEARAAK